MSAHQPGGVWIRVQPRYARILVPDENQHYRVIPKKAGHVVVVNVGSQCDREDEDESDGSTGMDPLSESDRSNENDGSNGNENHETPPPSSVQMAEDGPEGDENNEGEGVAQLDIRSDHDPPTTSKAAPPPQKKRQGYPEVVNVLEKAQPKCSMPQSWPRKEVDYPPKKRAKENPDKNPATEVKQESLMDDDEEELDPQEEGNTEEPQHRRLSETLPLFLEPETEKKLRDDMALIYDQQPEWLRSQIKAELQGRSAQYGRAITSTEANVAIWRNYRLKITQVTALFGVEGMSRVVWACLGKEGASNMQATG